MMEARQIITMILASLVTTFWSISRVGASVTLSPHVTIGKSALASFKNYDSWVKCVSRCLETQPELCTAQNVTEFEMEDSLSWGNVNPWKVKYCCCHSGFSVMSCQQFNKIRNSVYSSQYSFIFTKLLMTLTMSMVGKSFLLMTLATLGRAMEQEDLPYDIYPLARW